MSNTPADSRTNCGCCGQAIDASNPWEGIETEKFVSDLRNGTLDMSNTPETDGIEFWNSDIHGDFDQLKQHAMKLERERDEARRERDLLAKALSDLWHYHTLTDASYDVIEKAISSLKGGLDE